jgi:hypothetical protein
MYHRPWGCALVLLLRCYLPLATLSDKTVFGAKEGNETGLNDFHGGQPDWVAKCGALKDWDVKTCGGWSPREMRQGIPKAYLTALNTAREISATKTSAPIRVETKIMESTDVKPLFCYGMVRNPPEKTFEHVREVLKKCDGYMFFSNFSDEDRDIKQVVWGTMQALGGGEWSSALNTPVFMSSWRFLSGKLADRFKWFVKVDMDTVFNPTKLRTALLNFDHLEATQLDGAMGPMGINSQGAFLRYRSQIDTCEKRLGLFWPQEDMYIAGQVWRAHEGCDFIQKTFSWDETTRALGLCGGCDWGHTYISKFLNKKKFVAFSEGKGGGACFEVPEASGGCPDKGEESRWVQAANEKSGNNGCCIPLARVKCRIYLHGFKQASSYKLMSDWMNQPDDGNTSTADLD